MPFLRSRRRPGSVPAGVTLASLLPLGLMVGSWESDEDDDAVAPSPQVPLAA